MGDLIEVTGCICFDFHHVHVNLNYYVFTSQDGYQLEFTNIDIDPSLLKPSLLKKLKEPKITAKVLDFILDQATGKLPSTAKLEVG